MSQKWNLQDIRPPSTERNRPVASPDNRRPQQDIAPRKHIPEKPVEEYDPDLGTIDIVDGKSTKRRRIFISLAIAICIIGVGFFVNVLLGRAEVTVYPKFKDVAIEASFTAHKTPKAGELSYELLSLDATGERQVTAKGQEKVSERAKGTLFIYNTQKSVQRLITNTRFESPDGLIFRIKESVEVPGAATDAAGKIVPGVVTADVFADGTGEQYNVKPSRFTVPGLKGSDQFTAVYGESVSEFTGGFEGDRYILDDSELETTKQALHLELRNGLLERLKSEVPAGFVMYENGAALSFETLPSTAYGDKMATIKEKASLHVPLFKESEFSSFIAKSAVAGYEGEPVTLGDPKQLTFAYTSATATMSDISKEQDLEFTLHGNTRIIWTFDQEKLTKDLLNLPKAALPNVMTSYPAIEHTEAVLRPFWAQNFPETSDKIIITTRVEKREGAEEK